MKVLASILFFSLSGIISAGAQTASVYDSVLAKKLGGNANGMRNYILVILTTGAADIKDKKISDSLFKGHMSNMGRLANEGKLVVAGPFGKNDLGYRGIFVINSSSEDEAKALVNTDPAVQAGVFSAVYLKWFCTAALMETTGIHNRIVKPGQ
jgi:uncharacterized protein YciI